MSVTTQERIRSIFQKAKELPEARRAAFLDAACAGDPALRAGVEAMLAQSGSQPSGGSGVERSSDAPTAEWSDPASAESGASAPGDRPRTGPANLAALREGPGTRIDHYRLVQLIGEGGFGSVFLAEQDEPVRRRVALKIIKLGMDTRSVVARFEQERQALAMMDHPNIAKVLDAGATETGRPYFVMELVRGVPITDYCDRNNLTVPERLALFVQVCQAVQHAHHKGIIHRDLKPSNVLVYSHEGKAIAKVIDFGIAKAADYRLTDKTIFTEFRQLIGTPQYMSPEQAEGNEDIDTRTDVYSLGVLLYELLTGSTPFDSKGLRSAAYGEIQRIIREVDPPKPSTRLSSQQDTLQSIAARRRTEPKKLSTILRRDLDWVVMKALEKDRRRRYDSATDLAQDIERYLRDEPVSAGPPTASYKLRKFISRHRAGAGIAAAFLLLLIAGLVATSMLYRRADEQRRRAETEAAKVTAAYQFTKDMFGSIDPNVAKGREITVREVLDDAAKGIESALQKQPEVEGNVRGLLGEAYFHLAKYTEAESNLRRSYDLRAATLGPLNRETLTSLHNLGAALLELGKPKEAVEVFQKAADERNRAFGPADEDTLASRSMLAYAVQLTGDLAGAEKAIRDVVDAQSAALGKKHRNTLESRASLADVLHSQGKYNEALTVCKDLVADAVSSIGEDDTVTIDARSILAGILKDVGREPEAEQVLRAVVASKTRIYGAEGAGTLLSEDVLASTLRGEKKYDEAEALSRSIIERSKRVNGPERSATLIYLNNLAQTLRLSKKFDEAEPIYRRVLEARKRADGPDNRDTIIATNNLGLVLLDRGKPADALPVLQEALAGFERTLPAGHWMIGATRVYVGEALSALGRFDEAEQHILKGFEAINTALGATNPRTQQAAKAAVELYTKWGKADKAAEWQPKAAPPK